MRGFLVGLLVGIVLTVGLGVFGLAAVGHALAVEDPIEKADVIVAISGDTGARTNTAISLWKQGLAPLIVFSGAAIDPDSVSSAEIMRREALRQGVPESATLIEPASASTEENATEVARLMDQRKLRSAILVTSPYHQRRAALLFARAFEPAWSHLPQLPSTRSGVERVPMVETGAAPLTDVARAGEAGSGLPQPDEVTAPPDRRASISFTKSTVPSALPTRPVRPGYAPRDSQIGVIRVLRLHRRKPD